MKWMNRQEMDDMLRFWNASAVMDDVDEIRRDTFKADVRTGQAAALRQWAGIITEMCTDIIEECDEKIAAHEERNN
jgi:hypothetical protein